MAVMARGKAAVAHRDVRRDWSAGVRAAGHLAAFLQAV